MYSDVHTVSMNNEIHIVIYERMNYFISESTIYELLNYMMIVKNRPPEFGESLVK